MDKGGDRRSGIFDRMGMTSCTLPSEASDTFWLNEVLEGNQTVA
jgi:hypothetical protein